MYICKLPENDKFVTIMTNHLLFKQKFVFFSANRQHKMDFDIFLLNCFCLKNDLINIK